MLLLLIFYLQLLCFYMQLTSSQTCKAKVSCPILTSIIFCLVTREQGYMITHQRRCLPCLSTRLLVCEKKLSCNWQKYQATLSTGGTLLLPTVDVMPQDLYPFDTISSLLVPAYQYFILLISCTCTRLVWSMFSQQKSNTEAFLYPDNPFIDLPQLHGISLLNRMPDQ